MLFPFPVIPGNNNVSFPFPKFGNGISIPVPVPKTWEWNFHSRSRSQKLGMQFFIPVPVPKVWEWVEPFPFPFPNVKKSFPLTPGENPVVCYHNFSGKRGYDQGPGERANDSGGKGTQKRKPGEILDNDMR